MHRKKEILLFKALKNKRISISTANRFYSGNGGKDALLSLEYEGYLKHTGFGNFVPNEDKLDQLPESVVERFKDWKYSKSSESVESGNYKMQKQ